MWSPTPAMYNCSSPQHLSPLIARHQRGITENCGLTPNLLSVNSTSSESNSSDDFSTFLYPFAPSERPNSARQYRRQRRRMRDLGRGTRNCPTSARSVQQLSQTSDARLARQQFSNKLRSFSISKQGKMTDCGVCYKSNQSLTEPECPGRDRRATCPEIWLSPDEVNSQARKCVLRFFGSTNVGKRTVAQRIVSNAQISNEDYQFISTDDDDGSTRTINFIMNEDEYELEVIQGSALESEPFRGHLTISAIVYSVDRRESFDMAAQTLYRLFENRRDNDSITLVLVANKIDLQRCRRISALEGKTLAKIYRCAYVEISGIIPLNMEDLWKEILRKIQKQVQREEKESRRSTSRRGSFMDMIRRRGKSVVRSCEEIVAKIAAM